MKFLPPTPFRRLRPRHAGTRAGWRGWAACLLVAAGMACLPAAQARAEYRAHELEIVDIYDCAVNKRERCRRDHVRTGLSPDTYQRMHGGSARISVLLLATWMCRGDTSNYEPVCPRPAPRSGKFATGDSVKIKLERHITDGWKGVVEVAYYQQSVRSNVYGVRFPNRQSVYARYYEKDLLKSETDPAQARQGSAPGAAEPAGAPAQAAPPEPSQAAARTAGPAEAAPAPASAPAAGAPPAAQEAPASSPPPQSTPPQ